MTYFLCKMSLPRPDFVATMTDAEADTAIERVLAALRENLGATIRS